jgi:hypothetical protein
MRIKIFFIATFGLTPFLSFSQDSTAITLPLRNMEQTAQVPSDIAGTFVIETRGEERFTPERMSEIYEEIKTRRHATEVVYWFVTPITRVTIYPSSTAIQQK